MHYAEANFIAFASTFTQEPSDSLNGKICVKLKVLSSDANSATDVVELIVNHYKGKEKLKPFFEKLLAEIQKFNGEFEILPKKTDVSLHIEKQFVI